MLPRVLVKKIGFEASFLWVCSMLLPLLVQALLLKLMLLLLVVVVHRTQGKSLVCPFAWHLQRLVLTLAQMLGL